MSESHLDVRGRISLQLHTPHTITEPHQLELSPADIQGSYIHEIVSIPVHVNLLDIIAKETRQTSQQVSSYQQSIIDLDGPRRDVKLCVLQSGRAYVDIFDSPAMKSAAICGRVALKSR